MLKRVEIDLEEHLVELTVLSLVLLSISLLPYGGYRRLVAPHKPFQWSLGIVELVVLLLAIMLAHEALHATAMAAFGGKPKVGLCRLGPIPVMYVRDEGAGFTRNQYLVVALAPLLLSLALFLLAPFSGVYEAAVLIGYMCNLGGASGDIIFAASVCRMPRNAVVRDNGPVLVIEGEGVRELAHFELRKYLRIVLEWIALIVMVEICILTLAFAGLIAFGQCLTLELGPLKLFSFKYVGGVVRYEISPLDFLLAAVLLAPLPAYLEYRLREL